MGIKTIARRMFRDAKKDTLLIVATILLVIILLIMPLVNADEAVSGVSASLPVGVKIDNSGDDNNPLAGSASEYQVKETLGKLDETGGSQSVPYGNSSKRIVYASFNIAGSANGTTMERVVKRNENAFLAILNGISEEAKKIFMWLPRAQQDKLAGLNNDEAKASLDNYEIKIVDKDKLYKERDLEDEKALEAQEMALLAKYKQQNISAAVVGMKLEFELAKEEGDNDLASELGKSYAIANIEMMQSYLERVKYAAILNDDLTDDEMRSIVGDAERDIAALEEAKNQLRKAESEKEIDDAAENGMDIIKQIGPKVKDSSSILIQTKLDEIVLRNEQLEKKLECSLELMEKEGKNSTKADMMLTEMSGHVAWAKEDIAFIKRYNQNHGFNEAFPSERVKSANYNLNKAYELLKEIAKEIKLNGGDLETCSAATEIEPGKVVLIESH